MDLKSAGRARKNPTSGERRANSRQRSGLVPPAGWREMAVPVRVTDGPRPRRFYLSRWDLWIGYRYDHQRDQHSIAFLGLLWVWAHK